MIKGNLDVSDSQEGLKSDTKPTNQSYLKQKTLNLGAKPLNTSYKDSELNDNKTLVHKELTESQALNMALLISGRSSQASLPQREIIPSESQQIRTESFCQDLERFKKSFKKTFDDYDDDSLLSGNISEEDIFRYNSKHPSQQFDIESIFSKPNSLAMKLQTEKKSIKSKFYNSSSSRSAESHRENNNTQSTDKNANNRLFRIKNVFSRPGLNKKRTMLLHMGLNGNSEMRNNTDITSNGENDYVHSLDTSYDNNIREFQEEFIENSGHERTVCCDIERERYFKSDTKIQESLYTSMPTDHSVMYTQNVVEVLEHIEKQKAYTKAHREFSTGKGFTSLIERLENRYKQNRQVKIRERNSLLRRVNVSAYDLDIDKDYFTKKGKPIQRDIDSEQSFSQGLKKSFFHKHNLSVDTCSESQQQTEWERKATDGDHTSPNMDTDIDIQNLNKVFLNNKVSIGRRKITVKTQTRWQSQPKTRNIVNTENHNQSCIQLQPNTSQNFVHQPRKYTPLIRPREKKLTNRGLGNPISEIKPVLDGKEVGYYYPLIIGLKPEQNGVRRQPSTKPKKISTREAQLFMCYGGEAKGNKKVAGMQK